MYRKFFKRFLDITISLIFILCFWWLYIIIAILVKVKLGSPVLFKQNRPGLNEKLYIMYKFRTMIDKKDKNGNLLPDEDRLASFGKFLRSTSLDELPELWNVLKGEMSLVGPRPLMPQYLKYYTNEERKRHKIRPGITGWAQVNGRNSLTWEDKFKYDIEYINNFSFWLDIKIILITIKKVFKREDISDFSKENKEVDFDEYRRMEKKMKEKMKEKILLIGAGQHARVVLYNIEEQNKYEVIGILDKNLNKAKEQKFFEGIPILDFDYSEIDLKKLKEKLGITKFFISFGNMKYRKKVWEMFKKAGWDSVNIIHPNAVISKNAKLGEGILIECGCLITPNPIIGNNVVVNTGSQVNHDNIIEDHVYIASGVILSGGVKIQENTLLDDGVIVTLGKKVGKNSLIGAGAVVTKNIEDNIVAYGSPAKVIKENRNI